MLDHLKLLYVFLLPGLQTENIPARAIHRFYAISILLLKASMFRLMNFRVLLPFAEICEMCLFQERSSEILTPRYFAFLVVCKVIPCRM